MGTKYYCDSKQTNLMKVDGSPHAQWGGGISATLVGYPGENKEDTAYRSLNHWDVTEAGKTADDVESAALYFFLGQIVGDVWNTDYTLARCTTAWYGDEDGADEADYTCAQHDELAWGTIWGDWHLTDKKVFSPVGIGGWFSIDVTDMVKTAITSYSSDCNWGIRDAGENFGVAWGFQNYEHAVYKAYIEIEWAEAGGASRNRGYVFGSKLGLPDGWLKRRGLLVPA